MTTIYILVILGTAIGFFSTPLTALFTMYATEQTYPSAQASAVGYLFAVSQSIGFCSSMIWVLILDNNNKWKVYLMFIAHAGLLATSFIINLNTKEILNKTNY